MLPSLISTCLRPCSRLDDEAVLEHDRAQHAVGYLGVAAPLGHHRAVGRVHDHRVRLDGARDRVLQTRKVVRERAGVADLVSFLLQSVALALTLVAMTVGPECTSLPRLDPRSGVRATRHSRRLVCSGERDTVPAVRSYPHTDTVHRLGMLLLPVLVRSLSVSSASPLPTWRAARSDAYAHCRYPAAYDHHTISACMRTACI